MWMIESGVAQQTTERWCRLLGCGKGWEAIRSTQLTEREEIRLRAGSASPAGHRHGVRAINFSSFSGFRDAPARSRAELEDRQNSNSEPAETLIGGKAETIARQGISRACRRLATSKLQRKQLPRLAPLTSGVPAAAARARPRRNNRHDQAV